MVKVLLFGLPKISLNKWYAGSHWSSRTKIKNTYKILVKSQFNKVFPKDKYLVTYEFTFKNNPLDATNCVAMVKIIEDIIFENDSYNHIEIGGIKSSKGEKDIVKIIIKTFDKPKQNK